MLLGSFCTAVIFNSDRTTNTINPPHCNHRIGYAGDYPVSHAWACMK